MFESVCCYITNNCNFSCDYCYRLDCDEKYMDIKIFKRILEKLKEIGCKRIAITGGEPTLHPKLSEMIELSNEKGFYVDLLTNGTLTDLNSEIYKNTSILCLSLDGITNNGNKHRPKKQVECTKKLIEQYKTGNYPFSIKVSSVVTHSNYKEIIELGKKLLNDSRIIWRLFQCRPYGEFNNIDREEILSKKELKDLIDELNQNSFECNVYLKGLIDELDEVSRHILINTNGDLWINEFLIGNLLEHSKHELEEKCKEHYLDKYETNLLIDWRK